MRRFEPWSRRGYFHFELLHQSKRSRARVGRIHTPHGVVDTPGFVAVGTNAALKFVDHRQADEAGQQLIAPPAAQEPPVPGNLPKCGPTPCTLGKHEPVHTGRRSPQVY